MSDEDKTTHVEATEAEETTGDVEEDLVDTSQLKLPDVKLEKVERRTYEEEEDVVFKMRCKVFVFVSEDEYGGEKRTNFWKERGTGDVKLLQHKATNKIRALMRQEKTMKVVLNHIVAPTVTLKPNAGSDRSWCLSCFDYGEGEMKESTFALRFRDSENAEEFKKAYENARDHNAAVYEGRTPATKDEATSTKPAPAAAAAAAAPEEGGAKAEEGTDATAAPAEPKE